MADKILEINGVRYQLLDNPFVDTNDRYMAHAKCLDLFDDEDDEDDEYTDIIYWDMIEHNCEHAPYGCNICDDASNHCDWDKPYLWTRQKKVRNNANPT